MLDKPYCEQLNCEISRIMKEKTASYSRRGLGKRKAYQQPGSLQPSPTLTVFREYGAKAIAQHSEAFLECDTGPGQSDGPHAFEAKAIDLGLDTSVSFSPIARGDCKPNEELRGRTPQLRCSVSLLKGSAKRIRKVLDPEKTISLGHLQEAVAMCIGRRANDVFSERVPAHPVYPEGLPMQDAMDYQRERELKVLTALLPLRSEQEILDFVSMWNLVRSNAPSPDKQIRPEQQEALHLLPAPAIAQAEAPTVTEVRYKRTRRIARPE